MKNKTEKLLPYFYSTPFFVLLTLFMIIPFLLNIGISFTNYNLTKPAWKFVGFKNYITLLSDYHVTDAIKLTFLFIVGIVILTMSLGLFYALLMSMDIRGNGILKAAILLPWIIPESVTGYVWKWLMTKDSGIIYYFLLRLGLIDSGTSFFFDPSNAMLLVIIVNAWRTAPFVAIMTYAKLKAIPASYIEAAAVDGANSIQTFFHITIPWLEPILKRCAILLFIWSFNSYSIIFILTNGGPAGGTTTLPFLIRQKAFVNYNFGQSSCLAVISLLIIVCCWVILSVAKTVVRRIRSGRIKSV